MAVCRAAQAREHPRHGPVDGNIVIRPITRQGNHGMVVYIRIQVARLEQNWVGILARLLN